MGSLTFPTQKYSLIWITGNKFQQGWFFSLLDEYTRMRSRAAARGGRYEELLGEPPQGEGEAGGALLDLLPELQNRPRNQKVGFATNPWIRPALSV